MIQEYFQDGKRWNAEITYTKENTRLGTAGALRLIQGVPAEPFFVINGDIITKINFSHMLEFHKSRKQSVTVCAKEYETKIPYGVFETSGGVITKIVEKPIYRCLVNSGIYILDPKTLSHLPEEDYLDFPTFIQKLISQGDKPAYFLANSLWLDIGVKEDLDRANQEVAEFFFTEQEQG